MTDLVAAWTAELDRLQADAAGTELVVRGLESPTWQSWQEPELPGPIPPALLERATQLLARQQAARDALLGMLENVRHRSVYNEGAPRPAPGPVYVDLEA